MDIAKAGQVINDILAEENLASDQKAALAQARKALEEKTSRAFETEEEYQKQKDFDLEGNKQLEQEEPFWINMWSIDLERTVVLLKLMLREIRFDNPFRLVIDYDPEMKKPRFKYYSKSREEKE